MEISHSYKDIISIKNLCNAWCEFVRGKKSKKDVAEFSLGLSRNIFELYEDLWTRNYWHGAYVAFPISDPKPRDIHKASVRDRLLHHAIYRVLYLHFDKRFIYDSYSCRDYKGTHRAMDRFRDFSYKVSKSNKQTCWVLKCDVRKFFASIDQAILMEVVKRHISDSDTIWLIQRVVQSFSSDKIGTISGATSKGLPLGNLTSQLLVNIYMNEFDQYIKHVLKMKYYIRYADDFVIMHHDRSILVEVLPKVRDFLQKNLKLVLHPDKVFIKTISSGVDFLGWVHFSDHRVLRTTTNSRMFKKLENQLIKQEAVRSYLGLLEHGNAHLLRDAVAKYQR